MSADSGANTSEPNSLGEESEFAKTETECCKLEEEVTSEEGCCKNKHLHEVTSDVLPPGDLGLAVAVLPPALGACPVPTSPREVDCSTPCEVDCSTPASEDASSEIVASKGNEEHFVDDILLDKQKIRESNAVICEDFQAAGNECDSDDRFEIEQPQSSNEEFANCVECTSPDTADASKATAETLCFEDHTIVFQPSNAEPSSEAVTDAPFSSSTEILTEEIIKELYETALEHSEDEEKGEDKKKHCECNISCTCCQKGELLISKSLRRAKTQGFIILKKMAFPLVRNIVRFVWIAFELFTAVLSFILSIVSTVKQDPAETFNYVHLGLAAGSIALALVDLLTNFRCKRCHYTAQAYGVNEDQASCSKRWCACCSTYVDIVRMLLAEALIYPLIVCDLFEIVTGRGFEGRTATDRISFTLLILSCLSFILYVFIARIAILGGMIVRIQKARMLATFEQNRKETYSISALIYQIIFFLHLLFQMVTQVLALVAIGACIYFENQHFYEDGNTDTSVRVSARLWAMMAIGYITPILGFFSFFAVTYYWVQEFPIALCLDMISCWKMKHGPDDFIDLQEKIEKPRDVLLEAISNFFPQLETDFQKLHDANWCMKFTYPFRTPIIVIACTFYATLQMAFAVLAVTILILALDSFDDGIGVLSWLIYFYAAVGTGAIANAYSFMVASFWTVIIPPIALFVAGLFSVIALPLFLLMLFCAGTSN